MTRLSRWLMKIAGQNPEELVPRTDLEKGLAAIVENGSGGGSGAFVINEVGGVLDKTFAEVFEHFLNGEVCYIIYSSKNYGASYLVTFVSSYSEFISYALTGNENGTPEVVEYVAESEDDFPVKDVD